MSSILKSASGCGWEASRTCLMVQGRRVSRLMVPYDGVSELEGRLGGSDID